MEYPCPDDWQYERHPERKRLAARVAAVLERLRSKKLDGLRSARDTRAVHTDLFKELAPPHFPYFAGHYRGEPFRCLNAWRIMTYRPGPLGIQEVDARVGAEPDEILQRMAELDDLITKAVAVADDMRKTGVLSAEDQLLYVASVACKTFDLFLQVHPYANGNGHAARFIMWAILGRYGFWPRRVWTVEPRPPEPPYTKLLLEHRAGNTRPLIEYVMECIR